ncbi:MAG: YerC/YecD family TrpR-related protein [Oscillospiraceae bacterium]|nr:YerC/YecD family TrpR-related protein [Oscillospiraceae bacterium]
MPRKEKNAKREVVTEMYEAILSLETMDECVRFFDDLCSVTELRAIEQRFQVARMLNEGHVYNTILEYTGASSATISRVNRSLNYGKDGYDIVFKRLDAKTGIVKADD